MWPSYLPILSLPFKKGKKLNEGFGLLKYVLLRSGGVDTPQKPRISYGVQAPVFLLAFFTPLFSFQVSEASKASFATYLFSIEENMLESQAS